MSDQVSITYLHIDQLSPNPLQPRGTITSESLQDLVDSIKEHGILEPLVVANTPAGLQIIAGERRWRASKLAGLTQLPVIIKTTTPKGMLEMALVENVQRSDLNPIERAKAFDRLIGEFNINTGDLAKRVSKSPAYVSNSIRLLTLPDILKDGLLSGMISEGHARALAAIDNHDLMIEAYKIILRESGSVRRAEDLARRMKNKARQNTGQKRTPIVISEDIDKVKDDILNKLNQLDISHKNTVKLTRSQTETKLIIHLKGGLEATNQRLQAIYQGLLKYGNNQSS